LHARRRDGKNGAAMNDSPRRSRRAWDLRLYGTLLVLLAVVLLSSCAAGPNTAARSGEEAGFWLGLWHGIIVAFTFVISLFTDNVNVYEVNNNGNWYDFGFFFGVLISLGGAGSRARKRS
jgi:hypothetical protein